MQQVDTLRLSGTNRVISILTVALNKGDKMSGCAAAACSTVCRTQPTTALHLIISSGAETQTGTHQ